MLPTLSTTITKAFILLLILCISLTPVIACPYANTPQYKAQIAKLIAKRAAMLTEPHLTTVEDTYYAPITEVTVEDNINYKRSIMNMGNEAN